MKGLRASNFKRIHLGLLLDLLLMFLVPAVMCALLALIARQVTAAGMAEATVETLLRSPTLAVRAFYSFLVLQYCATLGEIFDIVVEDMDRQARGLQG